MAAPAELNKLTENERLITPEDWEALTELMAECLSHDLSIIVQYDTNRYTVGLSDEVVQGPQGFRLEIAMHSFTDNGNEKLYRSLRELVADGWHLLKIIATTDYLESGAV